MLEISAVLAVQVNNELWHMKGMSMHMVSKARHETRGPWELRPLIRYVYSVAQEAYISADASFTMFNMECDICSQRVRAIASHENCVH